MRAVMVEAPGGVDVLKVRSIEQPRASAGEVVIEVAACGICTLDVVTRQGTYRRNVEWPLVPGHEISGVVVSVGDGVRRTRVGDRVSTTQRFEVCGQCRLCRSGHETLCEQRRFLGQNGQRGGYAEFVAVRFMLTTNVPDTKLLLEKMSEMRLGKGAIPVVTNGGPLGAPELLKIMNKDLLEGVMVVIANWGGKGHEKLVADFRKKYNEPWMTQDSISTYGDIWILKDAMEAAKSADRVKVGEAIRTMDTTRGAPRSSSRAGA